MRDKNLELALETAGLLLREAARHPALALPYTAAAVVAAVSVLAAGEVRDWFSDE